MQLALATTSRSNLHYYTVHACSDVQTHTHAHTHTHKHAHIHALAVDACRDWYCADKHFFTTYLSKLITGWIPSLLIMLWQVLVLPVTMIVLVQVRGVRIKNLCMCGLEGGMGSLFVATNSPADLLTAWHSRSFLRLTMQRDN